LFEAKKRFGLDILNHTVTSNNGLAWSDPNTAAMKA
jgi:hypothetical protein